MTFYRGNQTAMTSEASQPVFSELNSNLDLTRASTSREFPADFSLEDVFAAMAKELGELFEEVTERETELNHLKERNSKTRQRQDPSFNTGDNGEYMEVLNKKGNFLERITAEIEKKDVSSEIPKAKVDSYQKYAALLKERHDNLKQDISVQIEDMKKTKQELESVKQQVQTFTNLMEDEESSSEGSEIMQMFKDAKTDMNTVLSVLYPANVKDEFLSAMALLTDGFMKNDSEQDQFVELSPASLMNDGMLLLMKDCVIVEHHADPTKYRLNMAE